jgi:hypothetical protein
VFLKHMTYKLDDFFEFSLKMKRHILQGNIYEGVPIVLYQTSSLPLLSELDRRHLIDLMQVDRCFIFRLDSFSFREGKRI